MTTIQAAPTEHDKLEWHHLPPTQLSLIIINYLVSGIWSWSTLVLIGLLLAEQGVDPWKIGLIGAIPWTFSLITAPLVPLYLKYFSANLTYKMGYYGLLASALTFATTNNIYA